MSEFWLISLPGERNPDKVYQRLDSELSKIPGDCKQSKFCVPPDLKVGTLDTLVSISDELAKLDSYAESIVRKVAHYMGEVLEEQRSKLDDNLIVGKEHPSQYITKFQWDAAKYPVKQTLANIYAILSEQLSKIESDLKSKSAVYNTAKNSLQTLERKQTGNLLTRDLSDIVKPEQFVVGSEYMQTLVTVVSRLIYEDRENGLWTVTLFRRIAPDFKNRAREHRFIVRDFEYDQKKIEESKSELSRLETKKKNLFAPLFRWLKVNFGEAFAAFIHIKSLRVFVESVLRYGLPVDFQAILIQPNKKTQKRIRDVLNDLYHHLDSASDNGKHDDDFVIPGMGFSDYYPYVSLRIECNMIESLT